MSAAATEAPPPYPIGDDRTTRCHYHERAPELPRVTPEDVRLPAPDIAGVWALRIVDAIAGAAMDSK